MQKPSPLDRIIITTTLQCKLGMEMGIGSSPCFMTGVEFELWVSPLWLLRHIC